MKNEERDEFSDGLALGRRTIIDESDVASALTSATARLIGIARRDGRLEEITQAAVLLREIVNRLEAFAEIAGSDTGVEGISLVLQEMVGHLQKRDYDGASAALTRRIAARGSADHRLRVVERAAREVVAADDEAAQVSGGDGASAAAADRRSEGAWAALREAIGA